MQVRRAVHVRPRLDELELPAVILAEGRAERVRVPAPAPAAAEGVEPLQGRDVAGGRPDRGGGGAAGADDADVVPVAGDGGQGLLLHVDVPHRADPPQHPAPQQHRPAGRAVVVPDQRHVRPPPHPLRQRADDRPERVEHDLVRVADEQQVAVGVLLGQVAQDPAGAAVLAGVARDVEAPRRPGRDALGGPGRGGVVVVADDDADGQPVEFAHARDLLGVAQPGVHEPLDEPVVPPQHRQFQERPVRPQAAGFGAVAARQQHQAPEPREDLRSRHRVGGVRLAVVRRGGGRAGRRPRPGRGRRTASAAPARRRGRPSPPGRGRRRGGFGPRPRRRRRWRRRPGGWGGPGGGRCSRPSPDPGGQRSAPASRPGAGGR